MTKAHALSFERVLFLVTAPPMEHSIRGESDKS